MNTNGEVKKIDQNKTYGYLKTSNTDDIKFTFDKTQIINILMNQISEGDRFEIEYEKNSKGNLEAIKISFKGRRVISSQQSTENNPKKQQNSNQGNYKYYLPADTLKIIQQEQVDNYSLKLNKFARSENSETDKEKFIFYKTERGAEKYNVTPNFSNEVFKSISTRHLLNTKSLLGDKNIKDLNLQTDWRMALGLGNESVYETSITLHHIYGIPYIPASAIKGVVRSWIITNCFADMDNPENPLRYAEGKAIENKLFCDLFGCPKDITLGDKKNHTDKNFKSYYQVNEPEIGGDRQGSIIFFDAFPTNLKNESIKVDIMNPHYGPYYANEKGEKPPVDYYPPIPIAFLTIENTSFQFIIGTKKAMQIKECKDFTETMLKDSTHYSLNNIKKIDELKTITSESSLLELAITWLKFALTDHGIGAKTTVGYGYMK